MKLNIRDAVITQPMTIITSDSPDSVMVEGCNFYGGERIPDKLWGRMKLAWAIVRNKVARLAPKEPMLTIQADVEEPTLTIRTHPVSIGG
jgi:hypothetical protein